MLPPSEYDPDAAVVTKTEKKTKLEKPKLYKVIIHNDDYTTMDFVVVIFQTVFQRTFLEAVQLMLQVHRKGRGVAGVYTFEVAQMKVGKATAMARVRDFPLLLTTEETEE